MVTPDWRLHCGDYWRCHVSALIGVDICDIVGPSPRRVRDWVEMMRRLRVRDMGGVISAVHGVPIPYRRAMRGDIVRRGWAIGICRGDRAEFYGASFTPMRDVDAAWSLEAALDAPPQAGRYLRADFDRGLRSVDDHHCQHDHAGHVTGNSGSTVACG